MSEEPVEIKDSPKKKRGRPRKEKPYREYQPYVSQIVEPIIEQHKQRIKDIFGKSDYITKEEYDEIKTIVATIDNALLDYKGNVKPYSPTITKKTPSMYKSIDYVREQQSKRFVMDFINNIYDSLTHTNNLIYLHLRNYVFESSKDCKI